ncbi:MAG: NusG domain II-containing protein [Oscillospiraceae bacterium]|nr:NusG domain II-containing protein [Oscillospiraceae bacterium]
MKAVNTNMDNNRKLLDKKDILIIVLIPALALGAYLLRGTSAEASFAVITLDGTAVDRISFGTEGKYAYPQIPGMVFTVREGAVSVTESDCGDRVCVRTGAVSHVGEAIICVPNRVAVTVEGGGDGPDVVLR